jgi:hypothetical protein
MYSEVTHRLNQRAFLRKAGAVYRLSPKRPDGGFAKCGVAPGV